jgi:hypothetical protein
LAASPKGGDASGVRGGIALFVGAALASIGLPEGIYLGGKWMGGNGGWWPTLGGCAAGGLLGLVPNIFVKYGDAGVTAVVLGIGALAGGIVGYNLSASPIDEGKKAAASYLQSSRSAGKGMPHLFPSVVSPSIQITILTIQL